jgi:NAD+ kinase
MSAIPPGSRIALYAKPGQPQTPRVRELAEWLERRGYAPVPDAPADPAPALAVVLGGDGSVLHAARRLAAVGTPIFAVHLGTLGFLADTAAGDLFPSLEAILAGRGHHQRRAMVRARVCRPADGGGEREIAVLDALNEVVVSKASAARIVQLDVAVGGEAVARYRADGVLVATPTGSTAYSFSAGGPVLHPALAALVITPICPHALNQRPMVVPAAAEITLHLRAAESACLTLDGQQLLTLDSGDRVLCTASPLALDLVTAAPPRFCAHLRAKLRWGQEM